MRADLTAKAREGQIRFLQICQTIGVKRKIVKTEFKKARLSPNPKRLAAAGLFALFVLHLSEKFILAKRRLVGVIVPEMFQIRLVAWNAVELPHNGICLLHSSLKLSEPSRQIETHHSPLRFCTRSQLAVGKRLFCHCKLRGRFEWF